MACTYWPNEQTVTIQKNACYGLLDVPTTQNEGEEDLPTVVLRIDAPKVSNVPHNVNRVPESNIPPPPTDLDGHVLAEKVAEDMEELEPRTSTESTCCKDQLSQEEATKDKSAMPERHEIQELTGPDANTKNLVKDTAGDGLRRKACLVARLLTIREVSAMPSQPDERSMMKTRLGTENSPSESGCRCGNPPDLS